MSGVPKSLSTVVCRLMKVQIEKCASATTPGKESATNPGSKKRRRALSNASSSSDPSSPQPLPNPHSQSPVKRSRKKVKPYGWTYSVLAPRMTAGPSNRNEHSRLSLSSPLPKLTEPSHLIDESPSLSLKKEPLDYQDRYDESMRKNKVSFHDLNIRKQCTDVIRPTS